jgi:bifunctional non-homologous end joining protein LigD
MSVVRSAGWGAAAGGAAGGGGSGGGGGVGLMGRVASSGGWVTAGPYDRASGYHSTVTDIPQPALATLSHERFWADGWVYERKLDGQRCLAVRTGRETRLYSRSGRDVTVAFPEIAEALEEQASTDFVVDGEVVAFEGSRTSFARLQPRIHVSSAEKARRSGVPVFFYVFDVLRADGEDVRGEPLLARKRRLRDLLTFEGPIRYTPHRKQAGEEYFSEACRKGWEGLIAKRADAAYATGRTDRWLKFKCEAGQELVVVGWTDPEGSRVALGALLLGYWDRTHGEDLVYAGKVGTGFSEAVLRDLHQRLSTLEVDSSPCTQGALPRKGVHWARPELVAQVAFTEWTRTNQLRHPRFLGLREDKAAAEVVRET